MIPVKDCYKTRFEAVGIKKRARIWKDLCEFYFQRYINKSDVVVDVGAGYCEFINNIVCLEKYAVDINPDTEKYANADVKVIKTDAVSLSKEFNNIADVVFISNFLEHLNSKEDVFKIFIKAKEILKKNGLLLILQPNIDLVREKYWNFFDHKTPLNEASLVEGLGMAGFTVDLFIKRFLPYSSVDNVFPTNSLLIKFYLAIPSIIRPFAGQSFVVARKA